MTLRIVIRLSAVALAVALSGCGGMKPGNDVGAAAANSAADFNLVGPAHRLGRTDVSGQQTPVTAAFTGKPLRAPAPKPVGAEDAITLGRMGKNKAGASAPAPDCDQKFQYSAAWAASLPAAFPLFPDAQVTEAAGNNDEPCRMRLISFASKAPLQTLVDFYYTQAIRNGFTVEHELAEGEHILAGTRDRDDSAYYLSFNARADGGTDVDMIVNHGR